MSAAAGLQRSLFAAVMSLSAINKGATIPAADELILCIIEYIWLN